MSQRLLTENRAIDLFVTYRFLKLLVTPWDKQEAYKLGIIDANGRREKFIHTLASNGIQLQENNE